MVKYTFEQFCKDNGYNNLLELWDYELNNDKPEDISWSSSCKKWFKCPRGLHESREIWINGITKAYSKGKDYCICNKCRSIGQFFVDNYGMDYLRNIWSDKNEKNPFEISKGSNNIIWLKCLNNDTHPDYDVIALNATKTHVCPYCSGRRVCYTNSFGYLYPEIAQYWSDINEKTPYDCRPNTHDKYYFKCENGIHEDYSKKLYNSVNDTYLCPKCALKKRIENIPRGIDSPYWKGDNVDENRRARDTYLYDNWRKMVYEKDNYTCQCCGQRGGKLNAHHIKDFAQYVELRYDTSNGITLCENHHDSNIKGSFHNTYGTHYKTPEELEEYINSKRKELGINIPFSLEAYKNGEILKPGDVDREPEYPWIFDLYSIDYFKLENNCSNSYVKINNNNLLKSCV